ncbi:GNAT family N-acetyltransferase, partial [Spongiactinospora gelatinilytica]|uniref:GNAT family N-acetyltransferase n=1 Tax=Spongiactinospora gelatinilytica TaxID=2666298 RepID=UPI0018F5C240
MAFTGHAVIATALPYRDIEPQRPDGYGACLAPGFLRRLAGPGGWVGVIDVTLVARGTGGVPRLPERTDADRHPRVRFARETRGAVRVHGDDRGLVTLAHGLAGRLELGIEAAHPGRGTGAALLRDALTLIPAGHPIFAAVAPGNARSLRTFLATGFTPIGSEVLL